MIAGTKVYCRFTAEQFTIVSSNGCVARVRDAAGNITGRPVGELTVTVPEIA